MQHERHNIPTENDPLLDGNTDDQAGAYARIAVGELVKGMIVHKLLVGELFDNVPTTKRQLGLASAIILIFNRVIGTGIFATPSVILRTSGSVGVAFLMWLVGACIAATGTAVYVELGTGSAAANSVVFGEYVIHSLSLTPSRYNTRLVAVLCLTFCLLTHGTTVKWGLRLQNALGMFKIIMLLMIATCGVLCLVGVPGFGVKEGYDLPRNFEWKYFWEGSGTGTNAFVTGLYNVIWSFVGYSNANYALSEIRDPVRTIKRAAPAAMLLVTTVYLSINIAYFSVVSKADILGSRRIIAALFFRNLFGPTAEKALSVFIALSTLGNLLSGQFSQGRVVQELGREAVLPFSPVFASNKPFNAPLAGLFAQYIVSCTFVLAPPPGDAYLFMISLSSYSLALINALVSFGLLLLHTPLYKVWNWNPPYQSPKTIIVLFFLSNLFLVFAPLIPPAAGSRVYDHLPYWLWRGAGSRRQFSYIIMNLWIPFTMSTSYSNNQIFHGWEATMIGQRHRIGALTLLMWDFGNVQFLHAPESVIKSSLLANAALTFEDETRYTGIFSILYVTSSVPLQSDPRVEIVLGPCPGGTNSWIRKLCLLAPREGWLGITTLWSVEVILQLRIYVLYNRSRRIAALMITAFCAQIITVVAILCIVSIHGTVVAESNGITNRCTIGSISPWMRLLWFVLTGFEFLLCALALYKGYEYLKCKWAGLVEPMS
ncbi:amino acid permease-domain-containing protein [Infundibulicybe gibba]|nr:amino acid permease-domain-containing protein [Infundibulicybe gibba]